MEAAHAPAEAGVQQDLDPQDVGPQEQAGVLNGAVHMALRREVDDDIRPVRRENRKNPFPVRDVPPHHPDVRPRHGRLQRADIARVGQAVQAQDPVLRVAGQLVVDEMGADEARAAGHQKLSHGPPPPRGI